MDGLSLIERRKIEAGVAAPLMEGFIRELGEERALAVARNVYSGLARAAGEAAAKRFGQGGLSGLARAAREMWAAGGALEIEFLEESGARLSFNVTRCRYAELYEELGIRPLGACLSCSRDAAFAQGFDPAIRMKRAQTIMEGAAFCDFRFSLGDGRAG